MFSQEAMEVIHQVQTEDIIILGDIITELVILITMLLKKNLRNIKKVVIRKAVVKEVKDNKSTQIEYFIFFRYLKESKGEENVKQNDVFSRLKIRKNVISDIEEKLYPSSFYIIYGVILKPDGEIMYKEERRSVS